MVLTSAAVIPRRPAEPRRDAEGLPATSERELRLARMIAFVASAFFAAAAAWELFGPLLAGHYASSASMGIIAENMLRYRILGPVWEYTATKPAPDAYYCHHPWGIFWTTVPFVKLFGHHDFVCRLPAVLLSSATPPLLYATGRALWRPIAGAIAAAAFVVLPITLAFAHFNALEVPVIAWGLWATFGYVRLTQSPRKRYLAMAVMGALLALNADWPAFVLVGVLLGFGLLRGFVLGPAWFGRIDRHRYGQWWALTATLAVLTLVLYLGLFAKSGKIADLFGSYSTRSTGNDTSLSAVLAARKYWIELSFTPIAIALGKMALPVILLRFLLLRREGEIVPLAWLLMASVQYVVFRQGADIHVFWPHYFGAYFAFAMGALSATLLAVIEKLLSKEGVSPDSWRAIVVGTALLSLPLFAILRDGLPALIYARGTGGRFNEKGLFIESDGPKTAFLRFMEPRLRRDVIVDMHESVHTTWSQVWALGGRIVSPNRAAPRGPTSDHRDEFFADTRFMPDDIAADLARRFHVEAAGPYWRMNRNEPFAPLTGYSIVESEPSFFARYFISGTEPERTILPSEFVTWEERVHFDQPADAPRSEPVTFDERRIAHNVAVAAGDAPRAAKIRAELVAELGSAHAVYEGGAEIVAAGYRDGASPALTVLVLAAGPMAADPTLAVRSKVLAGAALSTTMPDPVEREVGPPLSIAARRFRPGYLYSDVVPIRKRPGTEVFRAAFVARPSGALVRRLDGSGWIDLLTLR